jgi:subtilase family serine protease
MKRYLVVSLVVLTTGLGASTLLAQDLGADQARLGGHAVVVVPDSSTEHPEKRGKRAHTNHLILVHVDHTKGITLGNIASEPSGETPGSLGCVYDVVTWLTVGCPIAASFATPWGGGGTIAIVDAYDYPTAHNDLDVFSTQFKLPVLGSCTSGLTRSCFQVVYASGSRPVRNCGWAQEAALDIEWAHAMAPNAKIVLVEAASNLLTDLLTAVDVAASIVNPSGSAAGTGLGQVSMSWGTGEFPDETSYDGHFAVPGVVYFAASGDVGGSTIYPGVSPNVVSSGGTSVNRTGDIFLSETGWWGCGGGSSPYESIPSYQSVIARIVGSHRAVPDLSFDANPYTGVSVFDSTPCQGRAGWLVFGGTSVAAPSLAGIVNSAGSTYNSTETELSTIYACYATPSCYSSNFRDILSGTAGNFSATVGWDFVTGVGSNKGKSNK